MWKEFFQAESQRERDRYMGVGWHDRSEDRPDYRNGFYERDWVTRFGTIRLRIARTRGKNFLPKQLQNFQRRADDVALLIREAFLRGISTRQVGKVVAIVTGEPVSATTVSKLSKSLDGVVGRFKQARLKDEWVYLFLDGVSLRVRREAGRKRVQMLVAYGVKADGSRQLLGFVRSPGESQAAWEGLLNDLYKRGLTGENLQLVVTDGCAGLAAALATIYPHVPHQRCWVHSVPRRAQTRRLRCTFTDKTSKSVNLGQMVAA
jgi:transposase-like protein